MKPSASLRPMAITLAGRDYVREQLELAAAARAQGAEALAALRPRAQLDEPGTPIEGTGGLLRLRGDIAVVNVRGPLMRRATWFSEWLGWPTYDALWACYENIDKSGAIRAALFRYNTPGGDADGCGELADFAALVASRKRIVAYNESLCASAGIWLASQCNWIIAHETSESGSIGVRITAIDYSGMLDQIGIAEHEVVSDISPKKRGTPVDDEVLERIQVRTNDLAEIFAGAVARGRGVDVETVVSDFGQGDVMIARKAKDVGLVDEIGDFNSTLAALTAGASFTGSTARAPRAPRGAIAMADPKKVAGDADNEWKCKSCGEMMGPSADKHCTKCSTAKSDDDDDEPDGDEEQEAKAAGLFGATRGETRQKLIAFATAVLGGTGAKTSSSAIVSVLDGAKAKGELAAFRATTEKNAADARSKSVGDKLAAAIATGKIPLGAVAKEVPLLSGASKAAIRTSLAAIGEKGSQDKAAIVTAITSAPVSEEFAASVDEWIESKGASALPATNRPASETDKAALAAITPPLGADGLPVGADLSIAAIQKAAADKAAAEKGAR